MGSNSIPSVFKMFANSATTLLCAARIAVPKMKLYTTNFSSCSAAKVMHSHGLACSKSNGSMRQGHIAVACGAKDSDEPRALETVLKLYEAIKNRNVSEISDIISEECLCFSNFVSVFQPFHGKNQVLAFFSSLMKSLGNNIEFVVQQTLDEGMVVGVSWKLEWNKVPLPLGKGFSFYMCHVYQGKVMIKNVEIFIEPLLHVEPLRLVEKLNPQALFKKKPTRAKIILFVLLLLAAILFLLKCSVN